MVSFRFTGSGRKPKNHTETPQIWCLTALLVPRRAAPAIARMAVHRCPLIHGECLAVPRLGLMRSWLSLSTCCPRPLMGTWLVLVIIIRIKRAMRATRAMRPQQAPERAGGGRSEWRGGGTARGGTRATRGSGERARWRVRWNNVKVTRTFIPISLAKTSSSPSLPYRRYSSSHHSPQWHAA